MFVQETRLCKCAYSSLYGDLDGMRPVEHRVSPFCRDRLVERGQSTCEFLFFCFELFQDRPEESAVRCKSVTTAVQPGFDAKFVYPDAFFCQVFPLDQCRPVIAYLDDDLLVKQCIAFRLDGCCSF